MTKPLIASALGIGLAVAVGLFFTKSTTPAETVVAISPSPTISVQSYSLSDIAAHNQPTDCWFAIGASVYNVTSYIKSGIHPGEEAILLGCGKDATQLFSTKGSKGQPHSEKATNYLQSFKIGALAQP